MWLGVHDALLTTRATVDKQGWGHGCAAHGPGPLQGLSHLAHPTAGLGDVSLREKLTQSLGLGAEYHGYHHPEHCSVLWEA